MLINTVWHWCKEQTLTTKERNRDLRNKHRHNGQLILHKCVKNAKWEKNEFFNKWCW